LRRSRIALEPDVVVTLHETRLNNQAKSKHRVSFIAPPIAGARYPTLAPSFAALALEQVEGGSAFPKCLTVPNGNAERQTESHAVLAHEDNPC
jgi:hypothetical protein